MRNATYYRCCVLRTPLKPKGNRKSSKGDFSHFFWRQNSEKPSTSFSFYLLPLSSLNPDTKGPDSVQSSNKAPFPGIPLPAPCFTPKLSMTGFHLSSSPHSPWCFDSQLCLTSISSFRKMLLLCAMCLTKPPRLHLGQPVMTTPCWQLSPALGTEASPFSACFPNYLPVPFLKPLPHCILNLSYSCMLFLSSSDYKFLGTNCWVPITNWYHVRHLYARNNDPTNKSLIDAFGFSCLKRPVLCSLQNHFVYSIGSANFCWAYGWINWYCLFRCWHRTQVICETEPSVLFRSDWTVPAHCSCYEVTESQQRRDTTWTKVPIPESRAVQPWTHELLLWTSALSISQMEALTAPTSHVCCRD